MEKDYEQVLVDLILSFHQKYDTIHLSYIKAFVNALIEKEDLHSYIHYVDLYHENWNDSESFMSYNPVTKIINIHYDKYKKKEQEQSSLLSYFYFNCNLLHELYHVKERKISEEEKAHKLLNKLVSEGIEVDKFEIKKPTLNDIFIEKVGEK